MTSSLERDTRRVCDLVTQCRSVPGRMIIGIAGPPASGKSTLAEAVVEQLNAGATGSPQAALLPMDGYHLDNPVLRARGLLQRKGAPETFNVRAFCEEVRRLRDTTEERIFPRFDRTLDIAIANALPISPETPIVIVEGNYLLLNEAPWNSLTGTFTATVFVSPPLATLRTRLITRWRDHGLDDAAATKRAQENDLPNAERVLTNSREADLMLTQADDDMRDAS
ncbi:MAG: nucleoside/nucleotide kinase family protein [Pseudomonadota bacterium]